MWGREQAQVVRTDPKPHPPLGAEPAEDAENPGARVMCLLLFADQPPGQPEGWLVELRSAFGPSG